MTKKKQRSIHDSVTFNILLKGTVTYLRAKENLNRIKLDISSKAIKPLLAYKSKVSREAMKTMKSKKEAA